MALAIPLDLGDCEVSRKGHPSWHHYSLEYRFLDTVCLRVLISSPLVLGGDREGGDWGLWKLLCGNRRVEGPFPFSCLSPRGGREAHSARENPLSPVLGSYPGRAGDGSWDCPGQSVCSALQDFPSGPVLGVPIVKKVSVFTENRKRQVQEQILNRHICGIR